MAGTRLMVNRAIRWPMLIAATLVLHLVLIQPNHPEAMTLGALRALPLELPAILLALVAFGKTHALRVALTVVLTVIVALKTADFISFSTLSRGFNPVSDLPLIDAFVRLLSGTLGAVLAGAAVLAFGVAILVVGGLIWWAAGVWAGVSLRPQMSRLAGVACVVAIGLSIAEIGHAMRAWALPFQPPAAAFTARVGVERAVMVHTTLAELRRFRAIVTQDPFSDREELLGDIDRDVIVIFVESYGRTSLDTPLYADLHRKTLTTYETKLAELGLTIQSGLLQAPTQGGQSWLSHATFANGLWVNDQIRYGAALGSGRQTLFHHAARNGFHTAAVMPQITLDWPESARMGFETILPAANLGYEGLPFNWVTMPDQFTLAALDRLVRRTDDPRRVFAQVALASSHAPWLPVPQILGWDEIGDGQVYNEVALSGDPPELVWRDYDRVRAQYRLAVDYALSAVFEYALLHAADPPLLVIIGDHQAAEFVALDDRPHVPIHIIGPEHLVQPLSPIASTPGLLPTGTVIGMDTLRDIFLNAFSTANDKGL